MTASLGKRHRHLGVYGVLVEEGKLLVIRKGGDGPFTGYYDLPGGSIEMHEQIHETVVRELLEETGFQVEIVKQYGAFDVLVDAFMDVVSPFLPLHHIGIVYQLERTGGELNTTGDNIDSAGALWIDAAELHEENTVPLVVHVLRSIGVK